MKKKYIVILFILFIVLFISCTNEKIHTVTYLSTEGGRISGGAIQKVPDLQSANIVKAIPNDNYHFVEWSDGVVTDKRIDESINEDFSVTAIFERDYHHFPTVKINTSNVPITSKEQYVKCYVTINDIDSPDFSINNVSANIKGRGNSTWGMPKKPYKLKFDKKINLFGNGSAKNWTLLANYCDQSLARNYLAYNIANKLDSKQVTSKTKFIELYLNDSYQGVYLVCEQVEVGKNRIDIEKDYSINDGSFLIELDHKVYETNDQIDVDYFLYDNIPYVIKDPEKTDVEMREYNKYIKKYIQNCLETLKHGTFEEVNELIDVDSFVNNYLVQELFKNVDVKYSSWYLYKDKGGKLCNGPIWDMDISSGNCDYEPLLKYDYLYARKTNQWYRLLFNFKEFENLVKNRLIKMYYELNEDINSRIDCLYESIEYMNKNFTKWKTLGKYIWPNPNELVELTSWSEHVEYLRDWLNKSLLYLFEYYCKE